MRRAFGVLAGAALVAASVAGCGAGTREAAPGGAASAAASASAAPAPDPAALPADLGYVDYAVYKAHPAAFTGRKVVLFYWASWCPDCANHNALLTVDYEHHLLPPNLSVVKVDYDDNDVRQVGYQVMQQDTFVLVDRNGKALRKPLVTPPYVDILALAA
jgi:thiol-disulfide isomerase/thioredoxin